MTALENRTCQRELCTRPIDPRRIDDGYCSTECARINALVIPPPSAAIPKPLEVLRGRPERTSRVGTCARCGARTLVVKRQTERGVVRYRLNAEPEKWGRYLINGDRVIGILTDAQRKDRAWAGMTFAEHGCATG